MIQFLAVQCLAVATGVKQPLIVANRPILQIRNYDSSSGQGYEDHNVVAQLVMGAESAGLDMILSDLVAEKLVSFLEL